MTERDYGPVADLIVQGRLMKDLPALTNALLSHARDWFEAHRRLTELGVPELGPGGATPSLVARIDMLASRCQDRTPAGGEGPAQPSEPDNSEDEGDPEGQAEPGEEDPASAWSITEDFATALRIIDNGGIEIPIHGLVEPSDPVLSALATISQRIDLLEPRDLEPIALAERVRQLGQSAFYPAHSDHRATLAELLALTTIWLLAIEHGVEGYTHTVSRRASSRPSSQPYQDPHLYGTDGVCIREGCDATASRAHSVQPGERCPWSKP